MFISINFYFGWILYNGICLVLMLMLSKQIVKSQRDCFLRIFICAFSLLAIFGNAITPDHLAYREMVSEIASTKDPFVHIEDFYIWLIHHIGDNFFLYQCCVYLPVFLGLYWIFTRGCRLENVILFLFTFAVMGVYSIIKGRSDLFTVIYLVGIVLLVKKRIILGCACLFFSFFLHKVSFIVLPLTPLFFFPWKWNRKRLIIASFLFICIVSIGRYLIENNLSDIFQTLDFVQGVGYLAKEESINEDGSLWWQIIARYQVGGRFLLSFWVLYHLRGFCSMTIGSFGRTMYYLLFWITMLSLFFYGLNLPDKTIAGRTFNIGIIPLCYLISVLPHHMSINRMQKICFFFICFFYLLFNNAYIIGVSHSVLR